MDDLNKKK